MFAGRSLAHGSATTRETCLAGAHVIDDISISHAYTWGEDPTADAEIVGKFVAAVADLASYEAAATAA